jgi:hypothetical protein
MNKMNKMNKIKYNNPDKNIKLDTQKKYIIIEPNTILNTNELKEYKNISFLKYEIYEIYSDILLNLTNYIVISESKNDSIISKKYIKKLQINNYQTITFYEN